MTGDFAAIAMTLYVAHHVGDYWIQSHTDAEHKGDAGADGALHCLTHVLSYLATQAGLLWLAAVTLHLEISVFGVTAGLLVSGVTHYMADRRERGLMFWLARRMPWKRGFLEFGAPRAGTGDNPSLGTGAQALDQSWHIFWGVFVAGLLMAVIR